MKNKFSKVFFVIVALLAVCLLAVACNPDEQNPSDPVKYTVTYVGGTGTTGTAPTGGEYAESAKFNLPDAGTLAKPDHTFGGWSYGGTTYATGAEFTMPKNDVEFTAVWVVKNQLVQYDKTFVATLVLDKDSNNGFIEISNDVIGAQPTTVNFTYTLSGTALAITLANNGGTFNGTLENNVITITITYNSKAYEFKASDPTPTDAPTVTFDANGGTGTAPTISMESTPNGYKFIIPQNTFTAPANKEFDKWLVIINGNRNPNNTYKPGKNYYAQTGESIVFEAVWKNSSVVELTGTTYEGNCTVPTQKGPGDIQLGGKTYTQFVVNFETNQVAYLISTETQKVVVAATPVTSDIPTVYANATCYEVRLYDNLAYYLIFNADKTKMTIRESVHTDKAIANEEFLKQGTTIDTTKYTVTYNLGELSATEIASAQYSEGDALELAVPSGLAVYLEDGGYIYMSKMFVGWNDGTNFYLSGAQYNVPANNVTLNAVLVEVSVDNVVGSAGYETAESTAALYISKGYQAGMLVYYDSSYNEHSLYLTYTLNDSNISIVYGENAVLTGAYDETNGVTGVMNIKLNESDNEATRYAFGQVAPSISFNANGGTGNEPTLSAPIYNFNEDMYRYDYSVTLPENTFTAPNNMSFRNWSINSVAYNPGDVYHAVPGETVIIRVVWKQDNVTVTFDLNGGTSDTLQLTQTIAYNTKITAPDITTITPPANKEFDHWEATDGVGEFNFNNSITRNITLRAIWKDVVSSSAKTYVIDDEANLNANNGKTSQIVINLDTGAITRSYKNMFSKDVTENLESTIENGKYKVYIGDSNCWLVISEDQQTLKMYGFQTCDEEDLVGTYLLQA